MASQEESNDSSRLLKLPAELRLTIYELVICSVWPESKDKEGKEPLRPAILHVCCTTRGEAMKLYFQHFQTSPQKAQQEIRSISAENLKDVEDFKRRCSESTDEILQVFKDIAELQQIISRATRIGDIEADRLEEEGWPVEEWA